MSRSISFKLRGEALNAALKFSNDLGMSLNQATERALLWAIRKAYEPDASEETQNATLLTNSVGNPGLPSGGTNVATDPLAESEVATTLPE